MRFGQPFLQILLHLCVPHTYAINVNIYMPHIYLDRWINVCIYMSSPAACINTLHLVFEGHTHEVGGESVQDYSIALLPS